MYSDKGRVKGVASNGVTGKHGWEIAGSEAAVTEEDQRSEGTFIPLHDNHTHLWPDSLLHAEHL